jgi:hypothetical protein
MIVGQAVDLTVAYLQAAKHSMGVNRAARADFAAGIKNDAPRATEHVALSQDDSI